MRSPLRHRLLPALASALALTLAGGCASACKRVAADREDFLRRTMSVSEPHLALALPLGMLSQEVSRRLAKVPAVKVPLPELGIGGVDLPLGSLSARLHSIVFLPAAQGNLAFRARVVLLSGKEMVTTIDLEAEAKPRLDVAGGAIEVAITPADIARVRPSIPTSERARLGDFLYRQIPPMARRFVDRRSVDGLVAKLGDDLLGGSWPMIRDNLLGDIGTLTELSVDLPELPITALALRSTPADLVIAVHTSLPAAGLADPTRRDPATPAAQPQLRLSGAAVAELVNWEMAQGMIPSRYTREGAPSPKGEFEAGVTWAAGERPLRLHAWTTAKECAYVQFGGTPKVSAGGGSIAVKVNDAKIVETRGSAKVRAGVWFSGLGRQTFAVSESTAASVGFDLFGEPMKATATSVHLGADELALGLTLAPGGAAARRN